MTENTGRVEFTREMKKDYTIITPNMAPIHFELIKDVLISFGYKIDLQIGRASCRERVWYLV